MVNRMTWIWRFAPLALLLFACEKEAVVIDTTVEKPSHIAEAKTTGGGNILDEIEFNGEMFVFDSWEEFEAVETYLTEQVKQHNEAFGEQHAGLDTDAFNDLIVQTGFDPFQPLTDFEAQYGFNSKRQQINTDISAWLVSSGEELDFGSYPDNFPFLTQAARTLFTDSGETQIADELVDIDDHSGAAGQAFPPCIQDAYKREFDFYVDNGRTVVLVQTSSVQKLFGGVLQRVETSVFALRLSLGSPIPWRPYYTNLSSSLNGLFRDNCSPVLTFPFSVSNSGQSSRVFRQSAMYMKLTNPYNVWLSYCDITAKGGTPNFALKHCVNNN